MRHPHSHANERIARARKDMLERIDAVLSTNGGNTRDAIMALAELVAGEMQELRERISKIERCDSAKRKGR